MIDEPAAGKTVLVLHSEYIVPGGEESVVSTECSLLRERGHRVVRVAWANRDIRLEGMSSIRAATNCIWNRSAQQDVRKAIARHNPDVVHVHNTFPSASPAVILAAAEMGVPIVQTIHNFRLACVNGMLFRAGKSCELCVGKGVWRGVLFGCYRGNRSASAAVAAMIELHRVKGTWRRRVGHFLAVSERTRDILIRTGIPGAKITVRGHCLEADPGAGDHGGGYALIASRLSVEKGIVQAVTAWLKAGISGDLVIAGDGPERDRVKVLANGQPRIKLLGHVARQELMKLMAKARLLLLPSLWEEPAAPPLVAVEAIATGLPLLASGSGGLGDWVRRTRVGWTAPAGDVPAWAATLREIDVDSAGLRTRGYTAREEYLRSHSASRCVEVLLETYDKVCGSNESVASAKR